MRRQQIPKNQKQGSNPRRCALAGDPTIKQGCSILEKHVEWKIKNQRIELASDS
jgi:hypothetical protein